MSYRFLIRQEPTKLELSRSDESREKALAKLMGEVSENHKDLFDKAEALFHLVHGSDDDEVVIDSVTHKRHGITIMCELV